MKSSKRVYGWVGQAASRVSRRQQHIIGVVIAIAVAGTGVYLLASSHAASPYASGEAETGTLASGACIKDSSNASGSSYVQFGNCSGSGSGKVAGEDTTCQFLTAPAGSTPAFCDNFTNETAPAVSRSGPLSAVWGVSRMSNDTSVGDVDRWAGVSVGASNDIPSSGNGPCGSQAVGDVKGSDISVKCPGYPGMVETTNDGQNDAQTILAAYPRQPFDIAGRTGTAVFDATVNTQGAHSAWPTWVYTDEPVPTPSSFLPPQETTTPTDNAKNSIGIDFDGICDNTATTYCTGGNYPPGNNPKNSDFSCVTVGNMWATVNYKPVYLNMNSDGCVKFSTLATTCYPGGVGNAGGSNTYPAGPTPGCTPGSAIPATGMDHFEVRINTTGVYVYGQNYDQKNSSGQYDTPYLIADAKWNTDGNPSLPLTRGLTWMEDVHYNGDKFNHQAQDSFEWDNFGFDGPVLPRDAAYDVLDNTSGNCTPTSGCKSGNGYPEDDLGWTIPQEDYNPSTISFTINNVSTANATGSLMVFNWWPQNSPALSVSVNGNTPINVEDPSSPEYTDGSTGAVIIPLSEIKNGTNTFTFKTPAPTSGGGTGLANIDLIMQSAGGTYSP